MTQNAASSTGAVTSIRPKRRPGWILSSKAPRQVTDLPFFNRDSEGRAVWWDVEPPKTNYWPAHYMLGKAYAIDLLNYIHAARQSGEEISPRIFGCIAGEIARKAHTMETDGIYAGFFDTISEYLVTDTVSR
ncbi:MAG: hypothetical protein Q7J84_13870 [Sulfuricaulis sp.]|nr:hypothetical protein [Sulfuricaulis sp.]